MFLIEIDKKYSIAKERDPGLYEAFVGRDRVGRPETMKFSDVLMRCWMQERDPDTDMRKIDQDNSQGMNQNIIVQNYFTSQNKLSKRTTTKKTRMTMKMQSVKLKKRRKEKKKRQVLILIQMLMMKKDSLNLSK